MKEGVASIALLPCGSISGHFIHMPLSICYGLHGSGTLSLPPSLTLPFLFVLFDICCLQFCTLLNQFLEEEKRLFICPHPFRFDLMENFGPMSLLTTKSIRFKT